ncbi:DUF551 domain-containing protein [Lelliottia sp. V89_10]|uniref:DUF551 domain-containing protein n=1 Tax=Lelliottia wanjuensis TaxID=3050585 RepID=UPI00249DAA5D|nr:MULTISPECIES: DUF551 domain-containing protein [unclassified Lelliottia]MDI3361174.1 DUF551 domain-containing protein [Lelliottia sp. V89_13]MDK9551273.1 DUF551 domain-containing protein [Lelliottia sp. V89_5]MDK9597455.1 DUF551 domain-containing protein [Lelliottia sp. V89_10]
MTFTKEQLQHIIETDHVQCGDASALARMALAGMEADPVAYVDPHAFQNFSVYRAGETDNKRMGREWMWANPDAGLIPVYTAPQPLTTSERAELENYRNAQQVVPSEMTAGIAVKYWVGGRGSIESFVAGWNACRAAMQSGAVKDGWVACSERMPEDAQWCAVITEYGYYVQCWSHGQGWLGDDISIPNCDVTHWMPLPAAPKQEVKS